MEEKKSLHRELVKSFFLAFKRLSLYSVDHPLSKEILFSLFRMFENLLKESEGILIAIGSSANQLSVNKEVLDKSVSGAPDIYNKLKSLKIDGIEFSKGLTLAELVDFIRAMAKGGSMDAGKEVAVPAVLKEGSAHIKIKKFRYEKLEEGQKVVDAGDIGGGLGPGLGPGLGSGAGAGFSPGAGPGLGSGAGDGSGTVGGLGSGLGPELGPGLGSGLGPDLGPGLGGLGLKDVSADIREFLTGKSNDITARMEVVFEELDQNVTKVTDAIIESAKEAGDFEGVIKKFISWLSKRVAPVLVEKKKDPSKFIQKLFDSFQNEEVNTHFANAQEVIEECEDEIKIAMVEEAYASHKASPRKWINAAVKILYDEEDQQRLLPKFTERMVAKGMTQEEVSAFTKKIETELAKDEEVTISKKKLHKLVKLSERYDRELKRGVETETKALTKVNKRLSIEKERSDEIMRHLAEGLVVVDKAGKIVMMNPAAEKLLGKESKEAVGLSLVESIKDEHLLAVAKGPLDDKDETHITKEIELDSKDELTKRVLRASSAVVENEDGKTVGMVSVLSDITHEKEVEEMKSHFVSLVTHELRTPIVAIQKSIELILNKTTGAINDDQERFLSISKMNLERLNKLVNDLLDMSKLEAGKLVLFPSTFDFRDVVREVKASLASWANDKQITVNLDIGEQPLNISADRDRIFQVLVNFMGNALKFTPEKGEVSVLARCLEKKEGICDEPCLEVMVADTGIGIDPKDFKRIFNKFEQVSLVSPSAVGGTGLGLPISKEIINLHKGAIWVESQKGKGSRFLFVISKAFKSSRKES